MKKLAILFSFLILAGCGHSTSSGKTLVEINSKKITEGDLEFLSTLNPNIAMQLSNPFGKKQILDNLVEQELLFQASKKEGIDRDAKVRAKVDLYRKVILAQAYVESTAEKEARKYYDEHKNEFERLKLSHIMVRFSTPEELKAAKNAKNAPTLPKHSEQEALKLANEIYDKLKAGADFARLAKETSEDPATKEQNGDLGFASKEDPKLSRRGFSPLVEKAFSMKVGEVAGPIKTSSGYHIITVTAPVEQTPFEEAKNQILFKMRGEVRDKILANLKEKNRVVFAKEFETQPAPPQAPSMPGTPQTPPKENPGETPHDHPQQH